ncbi:hypothetical protein [Streptomyces sp. NPDC055107]
MIVEIVTHRPDVQARLNGYLPQRETGYPFGDQETKGRLDHIFAALFEIDPSWHPSKISQP